MSQGFVRLAVRCATFERCHIYNLRGSRPDLKYLLAVFQFGIKTILRGEQIWQEWQQSTLNKSIHHKYLSLRNSISWGSSYANFIYFCKYPEIHVDTTNSRKSCYQNFISQNIGQGGLQSASNAVMIITIISANKTLVMNKQLKSESCGDKSALNPYSLDNICLKTNGNITQLREGKMTCKKVYRNHTKSTQASTKCYHYSHT